MPVKHDLYQDLGLSKEDVQQRRASHHRLDVLLTQYDVADKEVLKLNPQVPMTMMWRT